MYMYKEIIDLLPDFAYEGNEYRLIATKKNIFLTMENMRSSCALE